MQVYMIVEKRPRPEDYQWTGDDTIYHTNEGKRQKVDLFYTTQPLAEKVRKRLDQASKFFLVPLKD